jgi:hypothetical protein
MELSRNIETMLSTGLSRVETSRRLGCSRSYVDYIAKHKLGIDLKELRRKRQEIAFTTRRLSEPLQALERKCKTLGLGFSRVPSPHNPYLPHRQEAKINGKSVAVRALIRRGDYYVIRGFPVQAEFVVHANLKEDAWLVMPAKAAPRNETMFSPLPSGVRPGRGDARHDYRDYLGAWHLLKKKN